MESTNEPNRQAEKFKELARELECDDDEARFDEKLKKLAPKSASASDRKSATQNRPKDQ